MGMTEHYIEIRSKCCGVKWQYLNDFYELEKIRIFLKVCGCDKPRYIFDSYVMNRTYVVPKAVELYHKRNLMIHMDLSDEEFRGKPKYDYRFLGGGTVKYRIPTEYRNKKIKILFISESPYCSDSSEPVSEPVIVKKDEDCCVCRKSFAEVKEDESDTEYYFEEGEDYIESRCVKEHAFHKTCLNKRWLKLLEEQVYEAKDKDRHCPICVHFKNYRSYCQGKTLNISSIGCIIYHKIKTNSLPKKLQKQITKKLLMIRKNADSDFDDSDRDESDDSDF